LAKHSSSACPISSRNRVVPVCRRLMRLANGGSTILLVHESNIQGNRKKSLEKRKSTHVITHQHYAVLFLLIHPHRKDGTVQSQSILSVMLVSLSVSLSTLELSERTQSRCTVKCAEAFLVCMCSYCTLKQASSSLCLRNGVTLPFCTITMRCFLNRVWNVPLDALH
jgi:hypothetical protein